MASLIENTAFASPAPNVHDFGETFNYGQWTQNTVITLVNVPWNADYRDAWRASSRAALDAYIDSLPNTKWTNSALAAFEREVFVPQSMNVAMQYNYLRANNPVMPISGDTQRTYYYFIRDIQYAAPGVTRLMLQLDVFQTFIYDVTFGSCFLERGHMGIANTNGFNHYGRDYLAEPEGLDIGGEYRIVHTELQQLMDIYPITANPYDILVCSTTDLTKPYVDASGNPQLVASSGGYFMGVATGASFYCFPTSTDFIQWCTSLQNFPWISQSVISITIIPKMSRYKPSGFTYGPNVSQAPGTYTMYSMSPSGGTVPNRVSILSNWRSNQFIADILGTKYQNLKKFLTYPYMVIEMTAFNGSPIIVKPEDWQDANATVQELAAFMPPGQRVVVAPLSYNTDAETSSSTETETVPNHTGIDDFGEFINMAVTLSGFPNVPIVNNMAAAFLADNKHGLAFQFTSADWAEQRALTGAGASYANAQTGIRNRTEQTALTNDMTQNTMMTNSSFNALNSLIPTNIDPVSYAGGILQNGVSGVIRAGIDQNVAQGYRNAATQQNNNASGAIADTNNQYAQYAARGDYQNTIAGVNAKIQDARMTQPSVSGQFGGDTFNLINGIFGYSLRWKMPNQATIRAIGDYWNRYGYAVHQYVPIPASLQCMTNFTYWKLSETYLAVAPIPERFKQTIRGLFEKGITIWNNPAQIGNITWDNNAPLAGVSY